MKQPIVLGIVAVGFLLLVLGSVWGSLFSGAGTWTNEKAAHWSKVKDRLHNLAIVVHNPKNKMHGGADIGPIKKEYEDLKIESQALGAEFHSAHDRPKTTAKILKWSGISMAVVGLIGWFAVKQSA